MSLKKVKSCLGGAALLTLAGLCAEVAPAQAVSLTPTNNATTLANTLIGSGSGISLVGTPTYTGAAGAAGLFSGGTAAGIGIESGIVLTSGSAANAAGPNNSDSTGTANGTSGDADLNGLISGSTNDASVLEFDFETNTGDLFFSYAFASEEYNEFANSSFNDVFGFFLDGNNIALIPGTTTPVAINTVNSGTNSEFYNNNDLSDGGPFFNIEYDGFTDVLVAKALGLAPGQHSLKLAIADTADSIYDSGVFIQAGSFSGVEPPVENVPEPTTILATITAAGGAHLMNRKRKRLSKKSSRTA